MMTDTSMFGLILGEPLKRFLYASGLLHAYHCWRNARTLTVVMLHRVLDPRDPRWATSDPDYTVSAQRFERCLHFFQRHYHVVSAAQVLAARTVGPPLPPRALLITFDDGWADTAEVALPMLRAAGLPALVFVVADAIDRREGFHQEQILAAWRRGHLTLDALDDALRQVGVILPSANFRDEWKHLRHLIRAVEMLSTARRAELLDRLRPLLREEWPAMLTSRQLRELIDGRVNVGAHGRTHLPMTTLDNLDAELGGALESIAARAAPATVMPTMSFPHGRYDNRVVARARTAGFSLMFTSDPVLNPARPLSSDLLGRIGLDEADMSDATGADRFDHLALHLFARPRAVVSG